MKMTLRKNVHIFKSNVLTLLKLGVGLDDMYTMGWIFLDLAATLSKPKVR